MLCLRRPNNPFCRLCFAMLFFHPQIFFQLGLDFLAGFQRHFNDLAVDAPDLPLNPEVSFFQINV